jgi:Rrf2 family transcriptional regulator, cysteine metabolism repressor
MPIFNCKVEYALRALVDLAQQPSGHSAGCRDIASRQCIPEPYLDQVLAALRRAGLVRSSRGSLGGYTLALPPGQVTVTDVVRALRGPNLFPELGGRSPEPCTVSGAVAGAIDALQNRVEREVTSILDTTTLRDLAESAQRSQDLQSFAPAL